MMRRPTVVLLAAYAALVVVGFLAGPWLAGLVVFDLSPLNKPHFDNMLLGAMFVYMLTSALPFIPGAEIGLALMLMLGAAIVPLVYSCMVLALSSAYLAGRFIPAPVTAAGFGKLGLHKARDLILRMQALDTAARLQALGGSAPQGWRPFLLRHRYLMLGLAFNLPGNTLIGGGGGIALVAGLSGLYSMPGFVATVVIAVAPVPLLFLLTGVLP